MAISENTPLATGKCAYTKCGAKINYRVTHGGLVFYTCRGEHELTQCRRHEKMGRQESREFLAKLEETKGKTANDNIDTGHVKPSNDNGEPEPEKKQSGNEWGLGY